MYHFVHLVVCKIGYLPPGGSTAGSTAGTRWRGHPSRPGLKLAFLCVAHDDPSLTYMKVRLTKETTSIMAQLGTTLSPQRAYASGTARPY